MVEKPLDEVSVEDVRRNIVMADVLIYRLGVSFAPMVNATLAQMADQLSEIPEKKVAPKDWCPGCGERALLKTELCDDCLSVGQD